MKENLSNLPIEEISNKQIEFYLNWASKRGRQEKNNNISFDDAFGDPGVIAISGLRMPPALGFEGSPGLIQVKEDLKKNLSKLRNTGIKGVVLESYMDRPHRIFYDNAQLLDYYLELARVAKDESRGKFKIGINLILFDIYGALSIAKAANLDFVAVDEFVDPVSCSKEESNFTHSFIFEPNPSLVNSFQQDIDAKNVLILGGTHSNYYPLVNPVDFETSIQKAGWNSAKAVILGKDHVVLYNSAGQNVVPVLVSGGVKYEDLNWIKKDKFRGFLAGSLFEEKFGVIDPRKVESVLEVIK